MNDVWESKPDNEFARVLFDRIDWSMVRPQVSSTQVLCDVCKGMNIWTNGFKVSRNLAELERQAELCALCKLFYETTSKSEGRESNPDKFELCREESTLKHRHDGPPLLSVYVDPGISACHGQDQQAMLSGNW